MASRDRVCNQILLYLDRKPRHGYELHRLLTPTVGDVQVTKLYRWLREMERNGLVECEERKGLQQLPQSWTILDRWLVGAYMAPPVHIQAEVI
jgi:DNA-binding PadR family transcriptional regulator